MLPPMHPRKDTSFNWLDPDPGVQNCLENVNHSPYIGFPSRGFGIVAMAEKMGPFVQPAHISSLLLRATPCSNFHSKWIRLISHGEIDIYE